MMPNGTPWHRAELLPNNKFFLVDSGVTISCPIAMKELPPSIMDIPPQVLKARLPIEPPKGAASFDSGTIEKLTQLVCSQKPSEMTCQVIGTSGDTLYLDLLTPNSERAATLLEKQQLLVSTLKSVFISHIDIPLTLYVQVNHEMVTWVQEQLEKPLQQLNKVTVGQICASEFDGCKYRAEVLNQKRVRFIDYGNEEDASTWWQLDPELAAIPPLCQIRYVKGTESLSEEVNTALEDLFDFEKEYVAVFEGEDGIVLFDDCQDLVDVAKKSAESNNNEDLQSLHETVKVEEVKVEPELEVAESEEPVVDSKVEEEVIEIVETLAELEVEEVEEGEIPASDLDETITSTHEVEPVLEPNVEEPEVIVEEPEVIFVEEIKMIVKEPELIVEEIKEIVKEPKKTVKKAKQPAGDTEFRPYYVSSFNSTLEFYVQPDRDAVEKLSEELSQQPDFPLADLAQDEMCAALSNHDGKWGRAQILSLRPPCGWFFDSGRESQIRSFKLLDKKHRYIDLLAKRCELKDSLTDVVFKEGQWIEAKIDEDGKVELKKELHWRKVVVTHYESHSEFYVRPAEDDPKYD
jgi:Tudor domain